MPEYTLPDGSTRMYEDVGAPRGPNVLLLHDAGQSRADLHPLTTTLAAQYRLVVPDCLHPDDPHAEALLLAALVAHAGAFPAAVIGIGSGAAVGIHLATATTGVYRIIADSVQLSHAPEAVLGELLCHTIVTWGTEDATIPRGEIVRTALAIPRAQRTDYPCGHGVFAHLPERFVQDVSTWLAADAPPAKLPLNDAPNSMEFDA